ncbi:hypothetical protein ACNAW0_21860 [Micromonospora sp. SL1-18]|uniref:hypothetical protein n=1 Tax=Micromonospora sp. SL1-18 TaxID=3399128 RepID=UPI003A4D9C41
MLEVDKDEQQGRTANARRPTWQPPADPISSFWSATLSERNDRHPGEQTSNISQIANAGDGASRPVMCSYLVMRRCSVPTAKNVPVSFSDSQQEAGHLWADIRRTSVVDRHPVV